MTNKQAYAGLLERLQRIESDPIGCGLARNWYINPDGPEAASKIEAQQAEIAALREAGQKAIKTLAASRHLIGKYVPDHYWLPEHDQRIADLKAALNHIPEDGPTPPKVDPYDGLGLAPKE